jgi:hypothetical protein
MTLPNCLFFIPSPRDITQFFDTVKQILYKDYDVLTIKYATELEAYQKARKFFLTSSKKYEWFAILPDDLILNQESFDLLLENIDSEKYKVLSGICNVSCSNYDLLGKGAATLDEMPSRTGVKWIPLHESDKFKPQIRKVIFAGFPLTFIHRSVLEQIDFKRDDPDYSLDLEFAESLVEAHIDQYVHFGAKFLHLRGINPFEFVSITGARRDQMLPDSSTMYVNVKKKKAIFHAADGTKDIVIPMVERKERRKSNTTKV